MTQAGNHSALLHHLKTVSGMRVAAAKADGRALHPVYLLEPTRPADSKPSWDVAKVSR